METFPQETSNIGEWIRLCRHGQWESLKIKIEAAIRCLEEEPSAALPSQLFRWVLRSRSVPISILEFLLDIDNNWLTSTNRLTGSVLHEAIQYQVVFRNDSSGRSSSYCSNAIPMFLLSRIVLHQQQQQQQQQQQIHGQVVASTASSPPTNLLLLQDGRGRTTLHCLLQSWVRTPPNDQDNQVMLTLWKAIYAACPESISVLDSDGTTPLMLLLYLSGTILSEHQMHGMLQTMLVDQPHALAVAPHRVMISHYRNTTTTLTTTGNRNNNNNIINNNIRTVSFAPSAVYCALLAGRSAKILKVLLDTNDSTTTTTATGSERSRVVTQYGETPLTIAVASQMEVDILRVVTEPRTIACLEGSSSVLNHLDANGLSVFDWLWLASLRSFQYRYHADSNRTLPSIHPSRRRYLPTDFGQFKHLCETSLWQSVQKTLESTINYEPYWVAADTAKVETNIAWLTYTQCEDIVGRLQAILFPEWHDDCNATPGATLPSMERMCQLIHVICRYQCPRGLLHVLLRHTAQQYHPDAMSIMATHRDNITGRLPLHDAAMKCSYICCYCVGSLGRTNLAVDREDASAFLYDILRVCPRAARVTDHHLQLPLHIAIEHAMTLTQQCHIEGRQRKSMTDGAPGLVVEQSNTTMIDNNSNYDCFASIEMLLAAYPGAIWRRDGLTRLYPALQAAAVSDGLFSSARLSIIYKLLRIDPAVLRTNC